MTLIRPRILLIGESCGDVAADNAIREIADITVIPRQEYAEAVGSIKTAVEKYGPFVAFAGTFAFDEPFPMRWDQGLLAPLFPQCKIIAGPGAGYDKVDIEYLTSVGAMYCNAPKAVGRLTSDGGLMLLLGAFRGLTPQDLSVRAGNWRDKSVKTLNWRNATVGIIGMGNIGSQLALSCTQLGMKVIYSNRQPKDSPYTYVSLDELYAQADAVVLTCLLTDDTRHLINAESLEKMKDGVIIVNIARGPCIDEQALVDALNSRKVLRAALDVFEEEPKVHPGLQSNPNVTLSPHNTAAPESAIGPMNSEVIINLINFVKTGEAETPVNIPQLKAAGKL